MNSTNFPDFQSVRLASGVEMQQRWSMQQELDQQQKSNQMMPRLIEISPPNGNRGTVVTVVVQSLPYGASTVKLAFNSLVVDTKQMQAQNITSLVATVPPFEHTNAQSSNVPVSICMIEKDAVIETWPIAEFLYDFDSNDIASTTAATATLPSTPSIATPSTTTDLSMNNTTRTGVEESYFDTHYNSFYPQIPQYNYSYTTPSTPTTPIAPSLSNNRNPPLSSLNYNQLLNGTSQFNNPMLTSAFDHATNTTSVTPSHLSYVSQRPASLPSTPTYYQKPSIAHIPATSVANYQPYPGLVSRANLKISGDLDSMTQDWTTEEWTQRRRLVQFWREQDGNEIRCTFEPLPQTERMTSGQIVVSCIYWAERNDCFITSVDCIHLLECLMDIRFSVEEKNRVRRNLEGFRPLTVSKCKAESADFFKLIMGFPNPKPRNIEKDVKVFPWKTLPYALKKIVTKYTASSYHPNKARTQVKSYPAYPTSTPSVYSAQSLNASTPQQETTTTSTQKDM